MTLGGVVAAVVFVLAVVVTCEIVWFWHRRRLRLIQDAQWRAVETDIRERLADPHRQEVIEDVRLRALSNQAQLSQLCQATATTLRAPAAVITVVEFEGQRWLAFYGAEWCDPSGPSGNLQPLDSSYCQYVVAHDQPLVITDSLKDIRVRTTRSEVLSEVRAYLGAPVHTADGIPVGSLCVFDNRPRKWSERDKSTVKSFASLVAL